MSPQRRDTDRHSAEAVERMWHVYADQMGIPGAAPAASGEETSPPGEPVRVTARSSRVPTVAAVVVISVMAGLAVMAGIALWPASPTLHATADRRSPVPMSPPAREAARIAPVAAPANDVGARVQAPTPAVTAADTIGTPERPVQPEAIIASRPVVAPETSQASATPSSTTRASSTSLMFRINFDFAEDDVDGESKRTLDKVIVAMRANPDWRLAIEGHTDALGAPDYNRALSERRAEAVKSYLQAGGVAPRRLSATGFGAARPMAPNNAPGNALNRRVELHRR